MNKLEQEPVAYLNSNNGAVISKHKYEQGGVDYRLFPVPPYTSTLVAKDFATLERAIIAAALMKAVKLPRWDVHQYDNLMEADASGDYIKVSDIQSLITEDGMRALRELVTKAVTEAVNEYSDYHYKGNEPDISNTVDRVLESK
jgi:hypothetical protein